MTPSPTMPAPAARLFWFTVLTAASLLLSQALACMTPFSALAALAAVQLGRRDGVLLMLICWAVSQAVGFGLLHYGTEWKTLCWSPGLGAAAVAAVVAAQLVDARMGRLPELARLDIAFVVGTVAWKAVVVLVATLLNDGPFVSIQPELLAQSLPRDLGITVALWACYRGLVSLGVPAAPRGAALAA